MNCPNCGTPIGRFELSPRCKKCGVNLYYAQQEHLLSNDAKKCELEFASFRILKEKLKSAFIGEKWAITRLVFSVLCIGVLFIPFAGAKSTLGFYQGSVLISALQACVYVAHVLIRFASGLFNGGNLLYTMPAGMNLDYLESYRAFPNLAGMATYGIILAYVIFFIALIGLMMLLTEILGFINLRRSAKWMAIFSALAGVLSLAAFVVSLLFMKSSGESVACSFYPGSLASLVFQAVMFMINFFIIKKNIGPKIDPIDLQRVETNKKVKAGTVKLEDLPLPVFETEEEKKARIEREKNDLRLAQEEKAQHIHTAGGIGHGKE